LRRDAAQRSQYHLRGIKVERVSKRAALIELSVGQAFLPAIKRMPATIYFSKKMLYQQLTTSTQEVASLRSQRQTGKMYSRSAWQSQSESLLRDAAHRSQNHLCES
jgi:hypothetical protein